MSWECVVMSNFPFKLFLLSNPEANRVAKLLLRSFTSVSVRVGVTSRNLQTSLRSRERSVEQIGSDTTFSSSCCSSFWAGQCTLPPGIRQAKARLTWLKAMEKEPGEILQPKDMEGFRWRLLLPCLIVLACVSNVLAIWAHMKTKRALLFADCLYCHSIACIYLFNL